MKSSMMSKFLITLVFCILLIPCPFLAFADGEDVANAAAPPPPSLTSRGEPIENLGPDPGNGK